MCNEPISFQEFEYEKKITKGCFEKPEPPQASNVTAMKYHELKMTGCVDSFVGDVKLKQLYTYIGLKHLW